MNSAETLKLQQACTILAGLLWFIALALSFTPVFSPLQVRLLYGASLALSAVRMLKPVFRSLRKLALDMNLLMAAAITGAILLGEWSEGALILWLFALADWIEDKSMARTTRAIESLMELAPDRVRVIEGATDRLVPTADVSVGQKIRLHPGDRVGLDARILSGTSQIMQAQVTGEPLPVDVSAGDIVYAGSINGNGMLVLETIRPASESTVARIIKLVQDARRTKAPMQKTVERFARHYTPFVFLSAICLTAIPVLLFQQPFSVWVYRSLVILLVGCPCAFIIATPVTLVSGLTLAARRGILIKGGAALEQASRLKAMVFDKTGTLTTGKPAVQQVVAQPGFCESFVLGMAAAISGSSGHLLGAALRQHCITNSIPIPHVDHVRAIPGVGAEGIIEKQYILAGKADAFNIPTALHDRIQAMTNAGYAIICIGTKDQFFGLAGMSDRVRPEAPGALRKLKEMGIAHLALLSGDHQDAVDKLAESLPLDLAKGACIPDAKLHDVQLMQKKYGLTAMIGDGINDAPALAGSDLGIAMGAGSDQALETADIALITDDIATLPLLIHIARITTRRVKYNIAIALILKFGFLALASMGYASLWMAVLADTGASLIVITNGLSLLGSNVMANKT
jgi:Zn2+/Cd2+-exporting ATPase